VTRPGRDPPRTNIWKVRLGYGRLDLLSSKALQWVPTLGQASSPVCLARVRRAKQNCGAATKGKKQRKLRAFICDLPKVISFKTEYLVVPLHLSFFEFEFKGINSKRILIMKQTKKQLQALYNQADTVAVISPYPKQGEVYSKGITGVASYSKNVVTHLPHKVLVLADHLAGQKSFYQEDSALVLRVWQDRSPRMWKQMWHSLQEFPQVKKVLIHFDFSMYGSIFTTGLLLPFLLLLKCAGYQSTVVAHHVILDVKKLSGHLGLGNGLTDKVKALIYTFIFRLFYYFLGKVTTQIIVLEDILQQKLKKVVNKNKIVTIPHAVDNSLKRLAKKDARQQLGFKKNEQVVLFFGFVNWFKGADFFVKSFAQVNKLLDKPARFVLAGGKSPTMAGKGYYENYFREIMSTIKASQKVEITGYVPQEKIAQYFAAADLIVFPYRDLMCASGVLSLAFSYHKPFLVSEELASIFTEKEVKKALRQVGLHKSDLVFRLTAVDLMNQTTNVLADGIKAKTIVFTKQMSEQKSFKKTAILYDAALFNE
jgi:glycosyltransferase involved in cell wall biosynthesis